ncbi:uncharacterized protein [Patagioenas fasciata]|uniref:uncharacterized protein n=1 Tax=Patagioenas fasciata TaxID=372321 RepID=UPI003A9A0EAE
MEPGEQRPGGRRGAVLRPQRAGEEQEVTAGRGQTPGASPARQSSRQASSRGPARPVQPPPAPAAPANPSRVPGPLPSPVVKAASRPSAPLRWPLRKEQAGAGVSYGANGRCFFSPSPRGRAEDVAVHSQPGGCRWLRPPRAGEARLAAWREKGQGSTSRAWTGAAAAGAREVGERLRTAERPELPERKGGEKETGASELLEASWQPPKARAALDVCCHRFTAVAPSSATEVPDRQKESRAVCPYKCVVLTSVGKKSSKTAAFLIPRSCIL